MIREIVITAIGLLVLVATSFADEVTLTNGRIIEGDVIRDDGKTVKIQLKHGSITVDKSEVVSILEKATPEQEYVTRVADLDASSAPQQLSLALWAESKKLEEEAIRHFIAAFDLDGSLDEAARALEKRDYHLVDGQWKDPDTYYPLRGWVRYQGRWIHPLEHGWLLSRQIVDKREEAVTAARAKLGKARAARNHAVAVAEGAREIVEAAPAAFARADEAVLAAEAGLRASDRSREDAARASERAADAYEVERLKALRGEPNSAGAADLEARRRKKDLERAEWALRDAEMRVARTKKALRELEDAVAAAATKLEKAEAEIVEADADLAAKADAAAEAEAELETAKSEAAEAKASWDKVK